MEQRSAFIDAYLCGLFTMTELCAHFGVSRRVGYKWLARFDAEGRGGLEDRSRAPHRCPHRLDAAVAAWFCEARRQHPDWGPRKLVQYLTPRHPELAQWPAASTICDLFRREGLVAPRRRRRHSPVEGAPMQARAQVPNALWSVDFKGQFRTQDGRYCYPLTVADRASRFLLLCRGLASPNGRAVRQAFETLFAERGLPTAIHTDNGPPFAAPGLQHLTALNIWWMRLGIRLQRSRPAHPQDNGAHERMHRTLKRAATMPPRATLRSQQHAFNRFRESYNEERPHDALHGATPASCYAPATRPYPRRLPPIEYPTHFVVRTVAHGGTFMFQNHSYFLSRALKPHPIGLEETDDGIWSVSFCQTLVARVNARTRTILRL